MGRRPRRSSATWPATTPTTPRSPPLADELERTRQFAVDDLRDRIEAARRANDPDGVIGLRDELARILHGEPIREVDRLLVKWLMALIQRRLRTGTVRPDVVELAGRVAERFGGTTEGASLRASLPTLRRSAGLCPRCGEPYAGRRRRLPEMPGRRVGPTPKPPARRGPARARTRPPRPRSSASRST